MFSRPNRYIFSYEKKKRAATRRRTAISIIVILVLTLVLLICFLIYNNSARLELKDDRTVEINATAKISDFIADIGGGTLVEDTLIDTSKAGEKELIAKIEAFDDIREYPFKITIVDSEAPVITISENNVSLLKGTPYTPKDKVQVTDNSGDDIEFTADGTYDPETAGEQIIKYIAKDPSGNVSEAEMRINVVEVTEDMPDSSFVTGKGHTVTIKDGVTSVDGTLIVNKSFGLPETYGGGLTEETLNAFGEMDAVAESEEVYLEIALGYRSYEEQRDLYDYYLLEDGYDSGETVKAGHSEHQSGLAMDISLYYDEEGYSAEESWIKSHCYEYGFILRYPEGKEELTGCNAEPWHIRYVGKDLAKALYNNGNWITLEEHFGIPSVYAD